MFQGYLCWNRADLHSVAEIEAGSQAHIGPDGIDAVFLATHQPTRLERLRRRRPKDGPLEDLPDIAGLRNQLTEGALVDEQELLRDFTQPIGKDPHLVFIVGGSGTGKSHIVKWLGATIGDHPDWHEVYIEKHNTGLQQVITTILADLHGDQIDRLRQRMLEAAAALKTIDQAKGRLMLELVYLLENPPDEGPKLDADGQPIDARFLKHCFRELKHLLNDPILRDVLLEKGGVIERITKLAMPGSREEKGEYRDEELQLSKEDLPLQPENLLEAARPTQQLVRDLRGSPQLQATAVALLNHYLATAKAQVFTGRGTDLVAVFLEVRQEIARRKKELCLFIEDLVLLHSIDRELAHVLTIGRGATGSLCALRAVVAVTEGYLDSMATLKTRGVRYSLDLKLGTEAIPLENARSFVARYLNAARVGPEKLVAARRSGERDSWVPNQCTVCPHQTECHAAFGHSPQGYGYYPFNEQAVDRLVKLASDEHFDPRNVIREVIRDPLDVAEEELPEGAFPSSRFAAVLDPPRRNVTAEVKEALRSQGETTANRRISLLSFWAGGANAVVNLDEGIHEAFDLPALKDLPEVKPPIINGGGGGDGGGGGQFISAAEAEIEDWLNGKRRLSADTARTIRSQILGGIVAYLGARPTGVKVTNLGNGRYRVAHVEVAYLNVRIDAAAGSGAAELTFDFEIKLPRTAASAVLFKSIVLAHERRSWAFDEDGRRYAAFTGLVALHAERLRAFATRSVDIGLAPSLRILALSARLSGALPDNPGELLPAVIRPPQVAHERSQQWKKLKNAADNGRRAALMVLRDELSAAKGGGGTTLFDVAPVLPLLKGLDQLAEFPATRSGTGELIDRQNDMRNAQVDAARAEWTRIGSQLDYLGGYLTEDDRWDDLQKTVFAAVDEAHNQGLLAEATIREQLAEAKGAVDSKEIERVRRLQRRRPPDLAAANADSLWDLVPDPGPGLDSLGQFLFQAHKVLTGVQRNLGLLDPNVGPGGVGVGAVSEELSKLGDDLDILAEEG